MDGTVLMAGGVAFLSCLGFLESYVHQRNLRRIPIRIHVNGTRGKSSVTRLIAAGLRAGGIRTCAKTTGSLPRLISCDGQEYPVYRPGRANIIEQTRIVKAAVADRADALVLECMALQPRLQSLCELKLVQATHGVITNARADHLDVKGPTVNDVAKAVAGTVPHMGILYTAEQHHCEVFQQAVRDRRSRLVFVDDEEMAQLGWDAMQGFAHIEHPENVALALRVCADLGVDRETALQGMWHANPDPGVMNVYRVQEPGRRIMFVNGFAANDPESTGHNWNMVVDRFSRVEKRIALFNCRADRADRSVQLAEACVRWKPADHYVLIGTATQVFAKRALAAGLDSRRLTCAERHGTTQLVDTLKIQAGNSAMVMGMGNISGPGMDVIEYFRERNRSESYSSQELQEAA